MDLTTISTVAVHNGIFHADDVFAVAALLRGNSQIQIVRTRDEAALSAADLRVDVGGKNSSETGDFDHHQRGGAGYRENGTALAAFGLVWRHYGAELCGGDSDVAALVERELVQPVDARDNGQPLWQELSWGDVLPMTVSDVISSLVPSWHESEQNMDVAFNRAVSMASLILERSIVSAQGQVLARSVVRQAVADAEDPRLVILPRFVPWQDVIIGESAEALFVVFESFGSWRVQCIPPELGSFGQRKPLPGAWKGLKGPELAALTGVSDSVFCHPGGFIAGTKSREGALALAQLALAE